MDVHTSTSMTPDLKSLEQVHVATKEGRESAAPDCTLSVCLVQASVKRHGVVAVLSQRDKQLVRVLLAVHKHKHLPLVAPLAQKAQQAPKLCVGRHDLDHVVNGVADNTPAGLQSRAHSDSKRNMCTHRPPMMTETGLFNAFRASCEVSVSF
jgi:hypothetical protein